MKPNLSVSIQDYLKTIFDLSEGNGAVSTTALAERLDIKPASVTGMIQRLANGNPPLVEYQKHQGVKLTAAGQRAALEVIRHHRLIETYLVETLGYSWDEVHDEADRLEHVISEDLEMRIATALGNPTRDPHGELIPTPELIMPPDTAYPLSELRPPQKAIILRVLAHDPALLRHLKSLGLVPGVELESVSFSPFDHNMSLVVDKRPDPIIVGVEITRNIFIRRGKDEH